MALLRRLRMTCCSCPAPPRRAAPLRRFGPDRIARRPAWGVAQHGHDDSRPQDESASAVPAGLPRTTGGGVASFHI
jgi:hypothetical protein